LSGDRHKVAKVINPDYLIYGEKNNVGDSHWWSHPFYLSLEKRINYELG
jgi:hypothetical protein